MNKEIRWKQRFENFEKAFIHLKEAVELKKLSDLEKEGLIQRFEYTFELAWKTLKDFLESKGSSVPFPRDAIKEGFHTHIVEDGEIWLDMLDKRNLMSHTYDEKTFNYAVGQIKNHYFGAILQLYNYLRPLK